MATYWDQKINACASPGSRENPQTANCSTGVTHPTPSVGSSYDQRRTSRVISGFPSKNQGRQSRIPNRIPNTWQEQTSIKHHYSTSYHFMILTRHWKVWRLGKPNKVPQTLRGKWSLFLAMRWRSAFHNLANMLSTADSGPIGSEWCNQTNAWLIHSEPSPHDQQPTGWYPPVINWSTIPLTI